MLLDANILLAAIDKGHPEGERIGQWLSDALHGSRRVAVPWQTIGAFVRIATHPRIYREPLSSAAALGFIHEVLASPVTWIPTTTIRTFTLFEEVCRDHRVTGNLVTDAQLAALALEYGLSVVTLDSDFQLFSEINVLRP